MKKFYALTMKMLFISLFLGISINSWSQGTEDFSNITGSGTSYGARTWTGTNGEIWTAADARVDQEITGKAICIRQTAGKLTGPLTTTQQVAGVGVITFKAANTAATGDRTKSTTYKFTCGSVVETITVPAMGASTVTVVSPEINSTDATEIVIEITGSSGVRVTIDDLEWTAAGGGSDPSVLVQDATGSAVTSFDFGSVEMDATPVEKTINIIGRNLTQNVVLNLSDGTYFSLDQSTLTPVDGNIDEVITITYTPSALGTYSSTLSFQAEVTLSSISLEGITVMASPVAIEPEASTIGEDSFEAQWNAVSNAENYLLNVYTKSGSSELAANGDFEANSLDGWSGTGVDDFSIASAAPHAGSYYITKAGTSTSRIEQIVNVEVGKSYVFSFWYNNYTKSGNGIKNYTIHGTSGSSYISTQDALESASGWTKYEVSFVAEETTVKISIRAYVPCDIDDISLAGEGAAAPIIGSPFTVTGTTYSVTGLSAATDYYYTVEAVAGSGSIISEESNEVKVTTKDSGVNIEEKEADGVVVYKEGNSIVVKSDVASSISVYSVSGKLVYNKVAEGNVVTIPLNKGVYVVKVGDKATKVVL